MPSSLPILVAVLVVQVSFLSPVNADSPLDSSLGFGKKHYPEYCAMYDICGKRSDGKVLNCPYNSLSVKPDDLFSAKVQSLCPTISGNVCCTQEQFETLRGQVQQAIPLLVGCPACLRNFLNLFCELSCSPDQSLFINVTSIAKASGNLTVDGIDFYVSKDFGEGLYNSCKDVKFGSMNTRAIDFVGAGAKNYKGHLLNPQYGYKEDQSMMHPEVMQGVKNVIFKLEPDLEKQVAAVSQIFVYLQKSQSFGSTMAQGAVSKMAPEWFAFLGKQAELDMPGSPYTINFLTTVPESSGMKLMEASVYTCNDTSLSCSCGDCPSAPVCSSLEPPPSQTTDACLVKIGPLKMKCVDLSMAILYVVLVSVFLGWGFSRQTTETSELPSSTEPLLNKVEPIVDETHDCIVQEAPGSVPQFQSTIQGLMCDVFRRYGLWVARYPFAILFSSIAIVLVLCLGLLHFKVETRPAKLWVGPGSKAAEEKHFFDTHLAPFYRIEQVILATKPLPLTGKSPSIVTDDNIQLLFELQQKVNDLMVNYSGSTVSLTDICLKPLGDDCAIQSILQYFQMDADNYDYSGGVEHALYCFEHYTSADTCFSAFKGPLDPSTVLGGFTGNYFSEASAFVVTYPVNNIIDESSSAIQKIVEWERAFIKLAKEELSPMVHANNLTLSFSSESSIEDELKRESNADVKTILISYLVMFAYISLTLGDSPNLSSLFVSSKVLLGLSGVVLVILSVLGSVGFFSAIGVKSTLIIVEVIPFLVLAVGVDNMCILVHAVKRQPITIPLEERISNALVKVGPSITLASLSEVLAFAVGGFISMPACRAFSMFAALAVLLDFLLQLSAFVALIVLDFKRAEDNRIDCFPCIKFSLASAELNTDVNRRSSGLLTQYMKEIHGPILMIRGVKVVVLSLFAGLTLASIALCPRIDPGLEQQIALPRDSYLQGYFDDLAEYLRVGPPLYFVVKNYNYSSKSRHTNQLCSISKCDSNSLLNEISRASLTPESSYIAKPAASWLDDFLVWLSPEAFGCCRKFENGSYCPPDDQPPCCSPDDSPCDLDGECKDCTTCFMHTDLENGRPSTEQFREKIPWFLNALPSADCAKGGHGAYTNSVELNGYGSGIIRASEFRTYHTPVNKQSDYVNALRAAREFSSKVSDSLKVDIFPYSVFYIFFEQYLDIWTTAVINIAIALGAVFIVCLILTSSLWSSAIILMVLAMIVVDLMGVMAILKIQLNAVSVVNLIMSIGIAVEFCVHITHAFSVSCGSRNERVKEALETMGASVFSGITLTKLFGVIVLYFARSEIFVVYYFQMYMSLVLIGFLHGLVFLPVVLSLIGPPSTVSPLDGMQMARLPPHHD